MKKQRLELTWIGKDQQPRLEPRILIEDPEKSVGDKNSRNMLIKGDNLLALKALEQDFFGKVKCIYIDPPFNTQQAFEHYDDGLEHSTWLNLMNHRLQILHKLLSDDGTLFVHIDDNELAYLTVLLDEIFGRQNRISIITFKQGSATGHKSINRGVVTTSNFLLMFAKDKNKWNPNRLFTARSERDKRYAQFIEKRNQHFSEWTFTTLANAFSKHLSIPERQIKKTLGETYEEQLAEFVLNNPDSVIRLARPDYSSVSEAARKIIDQSKLEPEKILKLSREGLSDMYFVNGQRILFYSDKLKLIDGQYVAGEPLTTIWDDILSNNLHNEGGIDFPKGKKPESLIKRCIELSTKEGEIVLDSFGGSGTTAAVAHKMQRNWILIEMGEHCESHIMPRLNRVISGIDKSGITKSLNWLGGGGFKYYTLAPSLLKEDKYGNWVIDPRYNANMLAAAMAKHENFRYSPDENTFWKQGQSTEKDFIFTTTNFLTVEFLDRIHDEMQEDESLLICCKSFQDACLDRHSNITVKKIPQMLLGRCEFGREDYSLHIITVPSADDSTDEPVLPAKPKPKRRGKAIQQASFLDDLVGEDA